MLLRSKWAFEKRDQGPPLGGVSFLVNTVATGWHRRRAGWWRLQTCVRQLELLGGASLCLLGGCGAEGGCHSLLCVQALEGSGVRGWRLFAKLSASWAGQDWHLTRSGVCVLVDRDCVGHVLGVVWGPLRPWVRIPEEAGCVGLQLSRYLLCLPRRSRILTRSPGKERRIGFLSSGLIIWARRPHHHFFNFVLKAVAASVIKH